MKMKTVPVKSAWASKINWTQFVAGGSMLLVWVSGGQLNLTPEQQAAAVVTIGVVSNVVTWVIKTWFTKSVTPASVGE